MANGFSRKAMTTVLVSSLLLSAGGAVVSAAPKEDPKPTGRTELNVQTGVIAFNKVDVPRYAKEVTLSGTVVIDGPQLVVTILDADDAKVTKIGDKLWTFEKVVDVSLFKGDTSIEISAKTIYANGKNAGVVHTSARTVTQEIHVPHITSTVAKNTEWTAYDRLENEFTLSYNEVENWSKGDPVVTPKWLTVVGTEGEVKVLGTTVEVPTAIQYFTFADKPDWEFDDSTKTYSATFDVFITDSKGVVTPKSVTEAGLAPGQMHTISHTVSDDFGTITETIQYTAPAAPEKPAASVVGLDKLEFTLDTQNKNQFKVAASYRIAYSDGTFSEMKTNNFSGTLANPTTGNQNARSGEYTIESFTYIVTAHYNTSSNTYYATWELKK